MSFIVSDGHIFCKDRAIFLLLWGGLFPAAREWAVELAFALQPPIAGGPAPDYLGHNAGRTRWIDEASSARAAPARRACRRACPPGRPMRSRKSTAASCWWTSAVHRSGPEA